MKYINKLIRTETHLIKQTSKKIGGMTYNVSSIFDQTAKYNAMDKLVYLVKNVPTNNSKK